MSEIAELFTVNWTTWFITGFAILFALEKGIDLVGGLAAKLGFEFKFMRKKREEHDLLLKTSKSLTDFQDKHTQDINKLMQNDIEIRKDFQDLINEMRKTNEQTQLSIQEFASNRVSDREKSREIQTNLSNSIATLSQKLTDEDSQVQALVLSQKEQLADRISQKYKHYISIGGVPEDEVDEFTNLHFAYKGLGGNHMGDAKYNYCMEHLPVVPVETKLIL